MIITLTQAQWEHLKGIVRQGARAESTLSKPIEIRNEHVAIEILEDEVKITLPDSS